MAVYEKYDGHCAYCGRKLAYRDMQVDHIKPQVDGGKDELPNLNPACRQCNHYKRDNDLEWWRHQIETIPEKLMLRSYIFKVGAAYGFWGAEKRKVKFYFEAVQEGEAK